MEKPRSGSFMMMYPITPGTTHLGGDGGSTQPHGAEAIKTVLPEDNMIRYQFGDQEVTFHAIEADPNRLSVEILTWNK